MILLIGGTEDAIELGKKIHNNGFKVALSTATNYGKKIVEENSLNAFDSNLMGKNMDLVLSKYKIKAVIDASHPYSTTVTYNAKNACDKCNIPYLLFKRPRTGLFYLTNYKEKIYLAKDFEEAAQISFSIYTNVLLTTGTKNLEPFIQASENNKKGKLYVRVLPEKNSITKCQELGLVPHQIVAIKGPLDYNLNKAIMESYNIGVIVTKDSGETGGTREKLEAALDLNINVVIIDRPAYKNIPPEKIVQSQDKVINWIKTFT